jgi:hypothetical protein
MSDRQAFGDGGFLTVWRPVACMVFVALKACPRARRIAFDVRDPAIDMARSLAPDASHQFAKAARPTAWFPSSPCDDSGKPRLHCPIRKPNSMDANQDETLVQRIAARVEAAATQTGAAPALATILAAGLAVRQGTRNLSKGELTALSRELLGAMDRNDAA